MLTAESFLPTPFTAVLAANPDFEIGTSGAAGIHRHFHQLAHAFLVEDAERIAGKDLLVFVLALELRVVVLVSPAESSPAGERAILDEGGVVLSRN